MLHTVPTTLEQRVASAVAGVLEQHTGELERLVAATVDRELDRMLTTLVERELEQRANGAKPARADTPAEVSTLELEQPAPAPRLCAICQAEPALADRSIGRRCKTRRDRERAARRRQEPDGDERPAGIVPDVLAERANHRGGPPLTGDELAHWLVAGELATLDELGELRPTPRGLELGAGLHHLERGA